MRLRLRKSHRAVDHFVHLRRAQVRSHYNHALREIDAAVVPQRECRLVKNVKQQLPQRVGSLFDFVEQKN